ncbi:hypothetical protein ACHAQJ_009400 [Trichoderma viride]
MEAPCLERRLSLESLSSETVLDILTQLADFDSLYNLIVASPLAWQLFNRYSNLITESILSSPHSLIPTDIQQFIRALILMRNSRNPFRFPEILIIFLNNHMSSQFRCDLRDLQFDRLDGIKFDPLGGLIAALTTAITAGKPSSTTLWSVVSTTRHISALAHGCLDFYLARVRDPSFAPKHCHERWFRYSGGGYPTPPWMLDFNGEPVMKIDIGPPSWVEEMRAMRALWFIQLADEVLISDPDAPNWRKDRISEAAFTGPLNFIIEDSDDTCPNGPIDEIRTAMEYLESLETQPEMERKGPYYRLPRPPKGYTDAGWITPLPELRQQEWSDGACYKLVYPNKVVDLDIPPEIIKAPLRSTVYQWDQTCAAFERPSESLCHWASLTYDWYTSPLAGVDFDSFRRFGFALWDRKRMYFLGLLPGPGDDEDQYFFAWESILPVEEVKRVKAELEEKVMLWYQDY